MIKQSIVNYGLWGKIKSMSLSKEYDTFNYAKVISIFFFSFLSIEVYSTELNVQKDIRQFRTYCNKISRKDLNGFMLVEKQMTSYYLKELKLESEENQISHLKEVAARLRKHPEEYIIHALVIYGVSEELFDPIHMVTMIPQIESNLKRISNNKLKFYTENVLGIYYNMLGKSNEELLHEKKALRLAEKIGDTLSVQVISYNISAAYFFKDEFDKMEFYLRKAIDLEKFGYTDRYFQHQLLMAVLLEHGKGKLKEAEAIYRNIEVKAQKDNSFEYYNNWGNVLQGLGRYQEALEKLLLAKKIGRETNKNLENTYINLSDCYSSLGDFEKSYFYLGLKDSLIDVRQKAEYLEELEELTKKNLINTQKIKLGYEKSKSIRLTVFLIFVLFVLLATIWFVFHLREKLKALTRLNLEKMETLENESKDISNRKISEKLVMRIDQLFLDEEIVKMQDLSIQKMAKILDVSATELSYTVNAYYKLPFRTLVNDKRVHLAKRMLIDKRYNHYSIAGIAELVGYANRTSFNRNFKEITGLTPSTFQDMAQKIKQEKQHEGL